MTIRLNLLGDIGVDLSDTLGKMLNYSNRRSVMEDYRMSIYSQGRFYSQEIKLDENISFIDSK